MRKRIDFLFATLLILLLIIAILIDNAILRGILLFVFSSLLVLNTIFILIGRKDDKFRHKFFIGILLFLEIILAFSSLFVIGSAILG